MSVSDVTSDYENKHITKVFLLIKIPRRCFLNTPDVSKSIPLFPSVKSMEVLISRRSFTRSLFEPLVFSPLQKGSVQSLSKFLLD